MQETVWRGTPAERQRLLASVARNCVAFLRQLSADETLGRSAQSLLSTWQQGPGS